MIIIRSLEEETLPLENTAVALGMFDGVHTGHREVLGAAVRRAKQDGLTPCAFTFALAEPRPLFKQGASLITDNRTMEELMKEMGIRYVLAPSFAALRDFTAQEYVAHVLCGKLGAKVVCCGTNFTFAKGGCAGTRELEEIGGALGMEVEVLPLLEVEGQPVSSSRIRTLIGEGDIPKANALLGRPFAINFPVVQGNRIGRTMGTPTINQPFPEDFIIPRFGVYATVATVDGQRYSGVTNVGVKPTVGSDGPLAETYIQGFSGDLYGREVAVSFVEFIRPEKKFVSIDELRENILRDAQTAAAITQPYLA